MNHFTAAEIRYRFYQEGYKKVRLQDLYSLNSYRLNQILDNRLYPPAEQRWVVTPETTSRTRTLAPKDREYIAHLIVYGAKGVQLAEHFKVSEPTITRIKKTWTKVIGTPAKQGTEAINASLGDRDRAAEIRYGHSQLGQNHMELVREYDVQYSAVSRILNGRAFRPEIELHPSASLAAMPASNRTAKAAWLAIYGASTTHIERSCEMDAGEVSDFVAALTSKASK